MLSILLAVPSCFNSFWHGLIPTSYFFLVRCPYFRVEKYTNMVLGEEESVLIREVSLFQGLNKHGTWGGRKCPV